MALRPDSQALLRNAIRYAEHGWPVFLLGRTKRPVANCPPARRRADHDPAACECLTCHGFYAATTDPHRLAAMLRRVPARPARHPHRRGVRAGRGRHRPRATAASSTPPLMTPTAAVATGGGGWHLYYRHPGSPSVRQRCPAGPAVRHQGRRRVRRRPALDPPAHRPPVPVGRRPAGD